MQYIWELKKRFLNRLLYQNVTKYMLQAKSAAKQNELGSTTFNNLNRSSDQRYNLCFEARDFFI